ncbi:hypothetical protein CIB48_g7504 [Xylaria polymorpha]|nr:hypothetical protein CIB48_g7504 [Xylaria polymorpha]
MARLTAPYSIVLPGKGKSRPARVLARETAAVVIGASPADIEASRVGNTKKATKALFNLGKKLAPSTNLSTRQMVSHENVNLMIEAERGLRLQDMDGLGKSKDMPFVLLSSNFLSELDLAVLGRVLIRLQITLPSQQRRKAIFDINLIDGILDQDVDTKYLEERTPGYSGSDIPTLCA